MADGRMIQEIAVHRWADLLKVVQQLRPTWMFRGHQNARWWLKTSLERSGSVVPRYDETALLERFQRRARAHLPLSSAPSEDDVFVWWSIMQHYGAPTRLLDFSASAYVALFFAVERPNENREPRALWAVDNTKCRLRTAELLAEQLESNRDAVDHLIFNPQALMARLQRAGEHSFLGVIPCEPWNLDIRQAAQQTQFLMPGRSDRSFEWNLQQMEPCPGALLKITFPDELRREIIEELATMNVTAATLFPGLDGFARSMHSYLQLKAYTLGELMRMGQVDPPAGHDDDQSALR